MTEQEMFIEALMSQFMEPKFSFPDIGRRVAELAIQNNDMTWRIWQAARTSPTADDAKPVGEAVAWLWNEKPCEFNDYQSRPRVTFVRPKNTEAPGGMQALGVIAATAQPAKDSGDALDAKRYRKIKEDTDACRNETFCLFYDDEMSALLPILGKDMDKAIDTAIASAEREGK